MGDQMHTLILVIEFVALCAVLYLLRSALAKLSSKKGSTEINVVWYLFSLVFVAWWGLQLALNFHFIELPVDTESLSALEKRQNHLVYRLRHHVYTSNERPQDAAVAADVEEITDGRDKIDENDEERRASRIIHILRKADEAEAYKIGLQIERVKEEGDPWSALFFYQKAKEFLTAIRTELTLVVTILTVAVAPQLFNYILAGLSGHAATPKFVWQFERIAIWSLIKFLAAFGGFNLAQALSAYAIDMSDWTSVQENIVAPFLSGPYFVLLAFYCALGQIRALELAEIWGDPSKWNPESWQYRMHKHFTRNVKETKDDAPAPTITFGFLLYSVRYVGFGYDYEWRAPTKPYLEE